MDILGNARAIIEYILRKNKTKIKLTMEDDGSADVTHEWKIPQADNSTVAETHKFVGESKQATLTNKTISADPSKNRIEDIYDASIHENANIQGSKLLDDSVDNSKLMSGIDGQKLVDSSVDTAQLANDSVTTDKIADGSVTFPKLEDNLYVGEHGVDITANVVKVKLVGEDATKTLIISENPLYNGTYVFLGSGYDAVGGTLTIDSDSSYGAYGRTDGTGLILFANGNSAYMFWQTSSDPALLNWDTSESGPYDPSIGLSGLEYLTPSLVTENGKYAPNIGTYEVSVYSYLETSTEGLKASVVDGYDNAEAGKLMDAQDIKDEVDSLRNYADTSSIDGSRLVDGTVTDAKIVDLDGSKLVDGSVSEIKLEDGSISDSKISDVNGSKLHNLSVTREKIADGAVDSTKLDAALIFDGVISDDSIEDRHIKEITDETIIPTDPSDDYPITTINIAPREIELSVNSYDSASGVLTRQDTKYAIGDQYGSPVIEICPPDNNLGSNYVPSSVSGILSLTDANGVFWEVDLGGVQIQRDYDYDYKFYAPLYSAQVTKDGVASSASELESDFAEVITLASDPVNAKLTVEKLEIQYNQNSQSGDSAARNGVGSTVVSIENRMAIAESVVVPIFEDVPVFYDGYRLIVNKEHRDVVSVNNNNSYESYTMDLSPNEIIIRTSSPYSLGQSFVLGRTYAFNYSVYIDGDYYGIEFVPTGVSIDDADGGALVFACSSVDIVDGNSSKIPVTDPIVVSNYDYVPKNFIDVDSLGMKEIEFKFINALGYGGIAGYGGGTGGVSEVYIDGVRVGSLNPNAEFLNTYDEVSSLTVRVPPTIVTESNPDVRSDNIISKLLLEDNVGNTTDTLITLHSSGTYFMLKTTVPTPEYQYMFPCQRSTAFQQFANYIVIEDGSGVVWEIYNANVTSGYDFNDGVGLANISGGIVFRDGNRITDNDYSSFQDVVISDSTDIEKAKITHRSSLVYTRVFSGTQSYLRLNPYVTRYSTLQPLMYNGPLFSEEFKFKARNYIKVLADHLGGNNQYYTVSLPLGNQTSTLEFDRGDASTINLTEFPFEAGKEYAWADPYSPCKFTVVSASNDLNGGVLLECSNIQRYDETDGSFHPESSFDTGTWFSTTNRTNSSMVFADIASYEEEKVFRITNVVDIDIPAANGNTTRETTIKIDCDLVHDSDSTPVDYKETTGMTAVWDQFPNLIDGISTVDGFYINLIDPTSFTGTVPEPAQPIIIPASGGISGDKIWDSSITNDTIAGYSGEAIDYTSVPTTDTQVSAEKISNGIKISNSYDLSDSDSYRLTDNSGDVWDVVGATVVPEVSPPEVLSDFISDNAKTNGYFGYAIDVGDTYYIVGARQEDHSVSGAGKAYVYSVATGDLVYELESASGGSDGFGTSVAVNDNYAVVGAYQEDGAGIDRSGRAYVFDLSDGSLVYTLESPNSVQNGWFGWNVAINDTEVAVGAIFEDDGESPSCGRVYTFYLSDGSLNRTWISTSPEANGAFGVSVSMTNDYAIVGANREDGGASDAGKAYIYDLSTGLPVHILISDNAENDGGFGEAISIQGNYVAIAAPREDVGVVGNGGRVYVYDVSSGILIYTLVSDNPANEGFGFSLSINSEYVIVGAKASNADSIFRSGKVYVYNVNDGSLYTTLASTNGQEQGEFGSVVSSNDELILIGAANEDDGIYTNAGKVYIVKEGLTDNNKIINAIGIYRNNVLTPIEEFSDAIDVDPAILDLQKGYSEAVDGDKLKVGSIPFDRLDQNLKDFLIGLGYNPDN